MFEFSKALRDISRYSQDLLCGEQFILKKDFFPKKISIFKLPLFSRSKRHSARIFDEIAGESK